MSYASPCMQIVTAPTMKVLLLLLGVITATVQQLGWLLGGGNGNDIVGTRHTTLRRGSHCSKDYRAYNAVKDYNSTGEVV